MSSPILDVRPLDFQWQTSDPFLFCAFHRDKFPRGNGELGPDASLAGRNIGQDFELRDGWRMYHGDRIPGFPGHPHRGFETITIVPHGLVDHADSLGAAGRYGDGDVQWMTAGKGLQHSEMFPLLDKDNDNSLLLFQIWLNLPSSSKMVEPNFTMFWKEEIPVVKNVDDQGKHISVEVIAGEYEGTTSPSPPPDSWAADNESHVAIWLVEMEEGATWTLPAHTTGLSRMLYFYEGETIEAAGQSIQVSHGLQLKSGEALALKAKGKSASLLLLQGKPIAEPVAHHGPFVMNTREELQQAFTDYQRDQFGGWPWERNDQVHGERGRFARYADGKEEEPTQP
jgi:redox-sensitive bicupin YhaK (pirin superfamily)